MKYLTEYMEAKQDKLFKKYSVFFAFNNDQFEEGMEKHSISPKTKLTSLGHGMYCPKIEAKDFVQEHLKVYEQCIRQDVRENGKKRIALRELANHECFWTGTIHDCVEKLKDYPITEKLILQVYRENYKEQTKHF
jgi:rubredoxin